MILELVQLYTLSIVEVQLLLYVPRTIVSELKLSGDARKVATTFKLSFHLTFARSVVLRYAQAPVHSSRSPVGYYLRRDLLRFVF